MHIFIHLKFLLRKFFWIIVLLPAVSVAQNYSPFYPITGAIQSSGSQQRISCSVYDSVLQSTQTFQSPWYNYLINITSISNGNVGFITRTTPVQLGPTMGLITYDIQLHQFKPYYFTNSISAYNDVRTMTGPTYCAFITEEFSGYIEFNYFRYNTAFHHWQIAPIVGFFGISGILGSTSLVPNFELAGDYGGYLTFSIYDPVADNTITMDYDPQNMQTYYPYDRFEKDDYVVASDNNGNNDIKCFAYDAVNHLFKDFVEVNAQNITRSGRLFYCKPSSGPGLKYFTCFDEQLGEFVADSIIGSSLNNLIMKNGLIAYSDIPPLSTNRYVKYRVYDPVNHQWNEDSTVVNGNLTSLTIQNANITWSDANGSYVRSFNPMTGWSNSSGQPFVYFMLSDLKPQFFPGIHVRNYSIGTETFSYNFDDGVISRDNRESMWHVYLNSGTYNVCLTDSATGLNYCQSFSINQCSYAGTISSSSTILCEGSNDTLIVTGNVGDVQWQRKINGTWVDESGPGADSTVYIFSPAATGTYRAKITSGNCISAITDTVKIVVNNYIPAYSVTDTVIPMCSTYFYTFSLTNLIPGLNFTWQRFASGNWINVGTNSYYTAHIYNGDTTLYRVIINSGQCYVDTSIVMMATPEPVNGTPAAVTDTTCGPGTVHLTSSGPGLMAWYDYYSTTLLQYGTTFEPYITASTDFRVYDLAGESDTVGYADNTIGSTDTSSYTPKGIRIYCKKPSYLESLTFYPEQTGTYSIQVYNAKTQKLIDGYQVNVLTAGVATTATRSVRLEGNSTYDFKISLSSAGNLYRYNNSGINFPIYGPDSNFVILGYVDSVFHNTGDFCNIYNLVFSKGCRSVNSALVTAEYLNAYTAFILPANPHPICQGQSIVLTGYPQWPGTYKWFRNGTLTSNTTISYSVTQPGSYKFFVDDGNCSDTSAQVLVRMPCIFIPPVHDKVTIGENGSTLLSYYNNEMEEIILHFENLETQKMHIQLFDVSGRVILNYSYQNDQGSGNVEIPAGALSNGPYFIRVIAVGITHSNKLIKY